MDEDNRGKREWGHLSKGQETKLEYGAPAPVASLTSVFWHAGPESIDKQPQTLNDRLNT